MDDLWQSKDRFIGLFFIPHNEDSLAIKFLKDEAISSTFLVAKHKVQIGIVIRSRIRATPSVRLLFRHGVVSTVFAQDFERTVSNSLAFPSFRRCQPSESKWSLRKILLNICDFRTVSCLDDKNHLRQSSVRRRKLTFGYMHAWDQQRLTMVRLVPPCSKSRRTKLYIV